jgi:hypothetical protein
MPEWLIGPVSKGFNAHPNNTAKNAGKRYKIDRFTLSPRLPKMSQNAPKCAVAVVITAAGAAVKSGETCADLAAMWGIVTQTVINWVERGAEGPPHLQGVPKRYKSRYRGRQRRR